MGGAWLQKTKAATGRHCRSACGSTALAGTHLPRALRAVTRRAAVDARHVLLRRVAAPPRGALGVLGQQHLEANRGNRGTDQQKMTSRVLLAAATTVAAVSLGLRRSLACPPA